MSNLAAVQDQAPLAQVPQSTSTADMLMNNQVMHQLQTFASVMAQGKCTVPKHLQGSDGDCLAITMQAAQWGMNPFAVAQKTHLVNGTLGYEAQLVNAVISSSKAIKGRFHYKYGGNWEQNGPDAWVQCGALLAGEEEITWGEQLYVAKVTTKNSPLWKTAPKQQAAYLAVKYWARMYCPDVILGVYTADELEENPVREREVNPANNSSLADKLDAAPAQEQAPVKEQPKANAVDHAPAIKQMTEGLQGCTDLESLNVFAADIADYANNHPDANLGGVRKVYAKVKTAIEAGANPETGEAV